MSNLDAGCASWRCLPAPRFFSQAIRDARGRVTIQHMVMRVTQLARTGRRTRVITDERPAAAIE
jgi:hypothetical protein